MRCRSRRRLLWFPRQPWQAFHCSTDFCPRKCFSPKTILPARHSGRVILPGDRHSCRYVQRRLFAALHPSGFLRAAIAGSAARTTRDEPRNVATRALLVLACLLVGILPEQTVGPLLRMAGRSILGADLPAYSLALWHGWTLPLLMSALAFAGGGVIYGLYSQRRGAHGRAPLIDRFDGKRSFDVLMVKIILAAFGPSARFFRDVYSRSYY